MPPTLRSTKPTKTTTTKNARPKVVARPKPNTPSPIKTAPFTPKFAQAMEAALHLQKGRDEIGKQTLKALKDTVCALEGEFDILQDTVHKRIKRLSLASRYELGKALSNSPGQLVNTDTEDLTKELLEYMNSMCQTAMAESGKQLVGKKYHKIQIILGTSFLFIEKELDQVVESKWKKIETAAPSVAASISTCGSMCIKKFMQTVVVVSQFLPADISSALLATAALCNAEKLKKADLSTAPCRIAVCFICQFLSKYEEDDYNPLIWAPLSLLKWGCRSILGEKGCDKDVVFKDVAKLDKKTQVYLEKHFGKYMDCVTSKKKLTTAGKIVDWSKKQCAGAANLMKQFATDNTVGDDGVNYLSENF